MYKIKRKAERHNKEAHRIRAIRAQTRVHLTTRGLHKNAQTNRCDIQVGKASRSTIRLRIRASIQVERK